MCGVFDRHGVTYLPRQRRLDFRHRQANLGSIIVNSLQWAAGVMFNAPQLRDFYLLQFTLEGECGLWQQSHYNLLPARSVAIKEILWQALPEGVDAEIAPAAAANRQWTGRTGVSRLNRG